MSKSKKEERLNVVKSNNDGELMEVVEYYSATNIIVEFKDEYKTRKKTTWFLFNKGSVENPNKFKSRLGLTRLNNNGEEMKVVEALDNGNVVVEFENNFNLRKEVYWIHFLNGSVRNPNYMNNFIGMENRNQEGYLMRIVKYNTSKDIEVEFLDDFNAVVHTQWELFKKGHVRNPYQKSVYGVGIVGTKYPTRDGNNKIKKEYDTWRQMLARCYDPLTKEKLPSYKNVICCKEWLLYENFYEWVHSQENFNEWVNLPLSALDKDILLKGNKVYCPSKCCLVPAEINSLFTTNSCISETMIKGVRFDRNNKYVTTYGNIVNGTAGYIGTYDSRIEAFYHYKQVKEQNIKNKAKYYYQNNLISYKCYVAMMNYRVDIYDK